MPTAPVERIAAIYNSAAFAVAVQRIAGSTRARADTRPNVDASLIAATIQCHAVVDSRAPLDVCIQRISTVTRAGADTGADKGAGLVAAAI